MKIDLNIVLDYLAIAASVDTRQIKSRRCWTIRHGRHAHTYDYMGDIGVVSSLEINKLVN